MSPHILAFAMLPMLTMLPMLPVLVEVNKVTMKAHNLTVQEYLTLLKEGTLSHGGSGWIRVGQGMSMQVAHMAVHGCA